MDDFEEKQKEMLRKAGLILDSSVRKSEERAVALGNKLNNIEDNQKRIMEKLGITNE